MTSIRFAWLSNSDQIATYVQYAVRYTVQRQNHRNTSMNLKFIIPILFLSCTSIQKNNDVCNDQRTPANQAQCANLFSDTNSNLKVSTINPSKHTKTRISEMTDAEILNYIDALVIERIKIDTGFYAASDNQKKQANEYFAKDINEIINKDQKYLTVYHRLNYCS